MKYMATLILALGLMLPSHAGEREDALISGLLGLGARALETSAPPAPQEPSKPARTSPREVAGEALAALAAAPGTAAAGAQQSLGKALTASLKPALEDWAEEYREKLKAEGREYARELGDMVVERVVRDPEIHASITSLRTLCWVVVGYLTLVTLIMLACLVYLRHANARLLAEVRKLARAARE